MTDEYRIAFERERARRKEAEKLLENKARELFEKNQELLESNEQLKANQSHLVHTEKMASVGTLAAGIAHEINNPLGFSLSNLHVLKDYAHEISELLEKLENIEVDQGIKDDLEHLYKEIIPDLKDLSNESIEGLEDVKQIVSDLRGFARTDDDQRAMQDVNEGIRATLNVLRSQLKAKHSVETDLGSLPFVNCNIGRLNQVFANLITNAVQAMPDGGHIVISTRQSRDHVQIDVLDDGPGVPEDVRERIFNPFFTTKPIGEGTGLGLSISYNIIVKDHNGEMSLENDTQQGAHFRIRLPIA
jgi:signal transduction histidine kinase